MCLSYKMESLPIDEFERLRLERLKLKTQKHFLLESLLKEDRAKSMQSWLQSGRIALENVGHGVSRVASYIRPHALKKLVLEDIRRGNPA